MKFSILLLVLSAIVAPSSAFWRGFNIKSNLADGTTCKTKNDWAAAFALLKTFPNKINSARLYSSYSCNTLANAVPAAISSHTKILVGINAEVNYEAEKGALLAAIQQYGWDWIVSVSVGSEDLYRGTINATHLASQIYDVRGMLTALPGYTKEVKVGHVDTTNAWFNASNTAVIRACEFVGTDIYPYYQTLQNNSITNAQFLFWNGVKQVRDAVTKAGSTASVWVTETGWPINGNAKALATPGIDEAETYWQDVACSAFAEINTFWFTFQDWSAVPSFAVVGQDSEVLYNLTC